MDVMYHQKTKSKQNKNHCTVLKIQWILSFQVSCPHCQWEWTSGDRKTWGLQLCGDHEEHVWPCSQVQGLLHTILPVFPYFFLQFRVGFTMKMLPWNKSTAKIFCLEYSEWAQQYVTDMIHWGPSGDCGWHSSVIHWEVVETSQIPSVLVKIMFGYFTSIHAIHAIVSSTTLCLDSSCQF